MLRSTEVKGIPPDDFISKQVWYESKDGTKVPMFIVRHKDAPLDGTAPGYQYGLFPSPHVIFIFLGYID